MGSAADRELLEDVTFATVAQEAPVEPIGLAQVGAYASHGHRSEGIPGVDRFGQGAQQVDQALVFRVEGLEAG